MHVALIQCCCSVGTPSSTSAQHYLSVGSAPRVCWVSAEISHLTGEHEPLSGCRFWVGQMSWMLGQLLNGACWSSFARWKISSAVYWQTQGICIAFVRMFCVGWVERHQQFWVGVCDAVPDASLRLLIYTII